jgi:uncharacterized protein YkwD
VTAMGSRSRLYFQSQRRIGTVFKPLFVCSLLKPRQHNRTIIMVNIINIVAITVAALTSPVTGYLLPSDPRFAAEFVSAHNRIRDQHGSSHVRWSPALANEAQAYANQCNFNHEPWVSIPSPLNCVNIWIY